MKRKCKLIAILTTAILLLTSAAATAEMIVIIEDIQIGALYQPAAPADDHGHAQHKQENETIGVAPMRPADLIIIEEDTDDDVIIETIIAPVKPIIEMDGLFEDDEEEEWITAPHIMPETDEEEDELIIAVVAPDADGELMEIVDVELGDEEMDERETAIAEFYFAYEGEKIHMGDTVTLIAEVNDGADVQWQQQRPGESWTDIAGASAPQHQVIVTSENADSNWRCLVTE